MKKRIKIICAIFALFSICSYASIEEDLAKEKMKQIEQDLANEKRQEELRKTKI